MFSMSVEKLTGKTAVKVIKDSGLKADQPTFVKIEESILKMVVVEVNVLSRLLAKRFIIGQEGFIGIAFR
jgi:hypothetical protein